MPHLRLCTASIPPVILGIITRKCRLRARLVSPVQVRFAAGRWFLKVPILVPVLVEPHYIVDIDARLTHFNGIELIGEPNGIAARITTVRDDDPRFARAAVRERTRRALE